MSSAANRRRVVIHEAAHACVGVASGLRVHFATIKPAELLERVRVSGCAAFSMTDALGHVGVTWPGSDADPEPYCCMLLSGAAAERRAFGDSLYDSLDLSLARDIVWVDVMDVTRLSTKSADVDAAMPTWQAKADRLVSLHWDWITQVADALEERVGLLPDEIEALQ